MSWGVRLATALLILGPAAWRADQIHVPGKDPHNLKIVASQYAFEPGTLQVELGDEVTIELVSVDVVHGLFLDGYGVSTTAEPGQSGTIRFRASQPGTYRFRCSVSCGSLHPFMVGELRVVPDRQAEIITLGLLAAVGLGVGWVWLGERRSARDEN